jgi:hypothetical protein
MIDPIRMVHFGACRVAEALDLRVDVSAQHLPFTPGTAKLAGATPRGLGRRKVQLELAGVPGVPAPGFDRAAFGQFAKSAAFLFRGHGSAARSSTGQTQAISNEVIVRATSHGLGLSGAGRGGGRDQKKPEATQGRGARCGRTVSAEPWRLSEPYAFRGRAVLGVRSLERSGVGRNPPQADRLRITALGCLRFGPVSSQVCSAGKSGVAPNAPGQFAARVNAPFPAHARS